MLGIKRGSGRRLNQTVRGLDASDARPIRHAAPCSRRAEFGELDVVSLRLRVEFVEPKESGPTHSQCYCGRVRGRWDSRSGHGLR